MTSTNYFVTNPAGIGGTINGIGAYASGVRGRKLVADIAIGAAAGALAGGPGMGGKTAWGTARTIGAGTLAGAASSAGTQLVNGGRVDGFAVVFDAGIGGYLGGIGSAMGATALADTPANFVGAGLGLAVSVPFQQRKLLGS